MKTWCHLIYNSRNYLQLLNRIEVQKILLYLQQQKLSIVTQRIVFNAGVESTTVEIIYSYSTYHHQLALQQSTTVEIIYSYSTHGLSDICLNLQQQKLSIVTQLKRSIIMLQNLQQQKLSIVTQLKSGVIMSLQSTTVEIIYSYSTGICCNTI